MVSSVVEGDEEGELGAQSSNTCSRSCVTKSELLRSK